MNKSSRDVMSFNGGIHPSGDGKSLSSGSPVQSAPLLDRYSVVLSENVGKVPTPVVKVGDEVKKNQLIAAADGFVSANLHSPTSGKVIGIVEVPGVMGVPIPAIQIEADGNDEAIDPLDTLDWQVAPNSDLLRRIADCGVVGMGGAAFPTHVKLSPPSEKQVDTLILNGAECEPYLTADHRLMLEDPESVLTGAAISGKILGVKSIYIGVEVNKIDAMEALNRRAAEFGVQVVGLKVQYPQGSEKQLIKAITDREVPAGGLPMDARCVVQNVGSAAAIADAVIRGIPLIERITSVTGEVIKNPGNWRLKIGTPVIRAIEFAGGVTEEPGKLIMGGPMMGFAQKNFDVTICKNSSGVLLLPVSESVAYDAVG
ncbi:MAG: electron transport complex subunit RsxC, partial [Victivallales bacterium]|nr:electron transport complex subunit RsxC [Victivallales bacterium]